MYELQVLATHFRQECSGVKMDRQEAKHDLMYQTVKSCFDLRRFQIPLEVSWF